MSHHGNRYDVTEWPHGDPVHDIGAVINDILRDVRTRQSSARVEDGGRPGAVIFIPPGDYRLRTQVLIDMSFVRIEGAGHGFTSSSIRFNVPEEEWPDLHELWPGGSRVMVDLQGVRPDDEASGAAFLVRRAGSPRISSVEFVGFCIDGLHFTGWGPGGNHENSYVNGKTGIFVEDANDSFRVNGMGLVYLENAITVYNADALSIHDNFVAECGGCIELRGWGQASKITDNLIGAGFAGHSLYAENHGGLLVTANNIFPRGASSVSLHSVTRSSVTGNRLHSFYPGMVVLAAGSSENLLSSNHFLRDREPWTPFLDVEGRVDDLFGLVNVDGDGNSILSNHFSEVVPAARIRPAGASPVIIRLASGSGNRVSDNHVVASGVDSPTNDSAYEAQVGALLTTAEATPLRVITVKVDPTSTGNTVLDSGTEEQVDADLDANAVRFTPSIRASRSSSEGMNVVRT